MKPVPRSGHLDIAVPEAQRPFTAAWSLGGTLEAERWVLVVRWLGIGVATAALPFLHLGPRIYWVILGATLYNLLFHFYVIPRKPEILDNGLLTTTGDTLLSASAVFATGGLSSDFFVVYFLVAVVAAIRFGRGMAVLSTSIALATYTGIVLLLGAPRDLATVGDIALRIGFVGITGIFVGFVGDRARSAEAALEHELTRARQLLTDATVAIAAETDLGRALRATAEWLLTLTGGAAAWVRLQGTDDVVEVESGDGRPAADEGHASHAGGADLLPRLSRLARGEGGAPDPADPSVLVVPMTYGDREIGSLAVGFAGRTQADETARVLMETFAGRAAAALANTRSRRQASTDPNTGIANHRRFRQLLLELETQARQGDAIPVSLLMIDLDRFKEFNDTFGHQAGDRVLRRVARLLEDAAADMPAATAARYGGDEFVILLPGSGRGPAMGCAERVLAAFSAALQAGDGLSPPVGLSIGVASVRPGEEDLQILVGRADLAMYMAKRGGGGRVRCFNEEDAPAEPLHAVMSRIAGLHVASRRRRGEGAAQGARAAERAGGGEPGSVRPADAVRALVAAIAAKDPALHIHSRNVARLSIRLARTLGLSEREVQEIGIAGLLHDLGKINVPDAILQKPGRLSTDEIEMIRRHAVRGAEILDLLPGLVGVAAGVKHHHEQYDGKGFPSGLEGDAIPIAARIVAAADAYDALTADRPYRPGRQPGDALQVVLDAGGRQFDPRIVAALAGLVTRRLSVPETASLVAAIAQRQ